MANLTYTKLAERNVSFQLLRTNPKLTTNVKLTIDSDGSLWLNSINANQQLADQKYKRFAINENSSHEINLYKFYDNGKTPSFVAYELGSTISKTVSAKDLKDQYDFDLYTSGAKYLNSRQYSEKFSYLAPLYLDQVMPSKFIIFKIRRYSILFFCSKRSNYVFKSIRSFNSQWKWNRNIRIFFIFHFQFGK